MYIKDNLLVVKHLEHHFFSSLPSKDLAIIKNKYKIGLYIGSYTSDIDYSIYDFVISLPKCLPCYKGDKPLFPFGGFNFLPSEYNSYISCTYESMYDYTYIGDLSLNKNLISFLDFHNCNEGRFCVLLRLVTKFDRFIIYFLRKKFKNITFLVPNKPSSTHARDFVLDVILKSNHIVIPYIKEGAARVFAEAEIMQKPIIYNDSMLGGTLTFINEEENSSINNYTKSTAFQRKNDKSSIYLSKHTTIKFEDFILKNFNIVIKFDQDELVNAFSGHKNLLCSKYTNSSTDEILSSLSFNNFLFSEFGLKNNYSNYKYFNILDKLKLVYKNIIFLKFWLYSVVKL